ncbi:MAG: fumarylacetoacetate hydrolase family protein, partial [Gammaproteobacteria bacterium]
LEVIKDGKAVTPFMQFGDKVRIEMLDAKGQNIFGRIEQTIEKYSA